MRRHQTTVIFALSCIGFADHDSRDLGHSWDIATDMAFKLVPGEHPYHAIAEAAAKRSARR
jgi:hypothetical protein